MFKRVMKEKGKLIVFYLVIMSVAIFLIGITLCWFSIAQDLRTWEYFVEETKGPQLSLAMLFLVLLVYPLIIYMIKRQEIESEDRVKAFAEKYKVGDHFWALSKAVYSYYDLNNPQTLLDNIFHFKVEEINFKKTYFKLSEKHRPKWSLCRTGMPDFIIYDTKDDFITWLKLFQENSERKLKELNLIIEGVIND